MIWKDIKKKLGRHQCSGDSREEGGEFFARQEKNRRELWKETEEVNVITKREEKTAATAVFSLFLRVSLNID